MRDDKRPEECVRGSAPESMDDPETTSQATAEGDAARPEVGASQVGPHRFHRLGGVVGRLVDVEAVVHHHTVPPAVRHIHIPAWIYRQAARSSHQQPALGRMLQHRQA